MNELMDFNFNGNTVTTVIDEKGDPWWVAKEVCEIFGLTNTSMAVQKLDDFERSKFNLGRQGEAWIIDESGLYSLILRSRKPEAKVFKKWVTSEVLPAIRKTGGYRIPAPAKEKTDDMFTGLY
ncbi:MAG: BRO family protein [Desulfobacteraceae bacterium]|jgi:anti-repressor protein